MWKHPKYYKELRSRNKELSAVQPCDREATLSSDSDQVISLSPRDGVVERAPDPGLKQQATSQTKTSLSSESLKHQATSVKS